MTLVIMLQGEFAGQKLNLPTVNAAAGVTDGWAAPTTGGYPFATDKINHKVKPAASYDTWVAAGEPALDPVTGAIVTLTKTNPAVVTLSAADFGKFTTGDKVTLSGTGVPAIHGPQYTLASPNATNKTFVLTGLDLSGQVANLATGTMTKV